MVMISQWPPLLCEYAHLKMMSGEWGFSSHSKRHHIDGKVYTKGSSILYFSLTVYSCYRFFYLSIEKCRMGDMFRVSNRDVRSVVS